MKIKNFKINSYDQVIVKITGEVLRAFHIEEANEYEPVDFEKFEIFNEVRDNTTVKTRLVVKKNGVERKFKELANVNPEEKLGAEIHRLIKRNLYKILTEDLKIAPIPYGIMHGVRPTKIVHRWLRGGFGVTSHGVIDKDRIARRLRNEYLTSFEKSELLTEVAVRQIPILNSADDKTIGIYVGIPFCVTRCLYCSFPSNILPDDKKVAEFMQVLTKDIKAAATEIKRYGFKVQSIYIGGGTPTALPEKFFAEMLKKVTAAFYSESVEEFTVECGRPDTIDNEKILLMKNCHVTRVSVNPQSMQQKTLDRIGRQHSIEDVAMKFAALHTIGKFKINMDLILGLPGETLEDVNDTLEKVLSMKPADITLHALAIKRGSPLQTQLADELHKLEDFELPDDAEVRKMADLAEKMLRENDYQPYYLYRQGYISGQIENIGYCKAGAEGIYNVQIMDERQTILGIGAAASTKVPDNEELRLQTSFNAKDLNTYLNDIDKYIENRAKTLAEVYKPVEGFIAPTFENIDAIKPVEEILEKPVEEIVEKPAEEILENPVEEILEKPVEEILEKPVEEIFEKPVEEIFEKPVEEILENPVEEILEKPVEEIVENPVEEIVENPVEEILEKPVEEIVENPVEEILENPVEEILEKPVEEILEKPAEEILENPVEEILEKPVEEILEKPVEEILENPDEEILEKPVEEILENPVEEIVENIDEYYFEQFLDDIFNPVEENIEKPSEDLFKTPEDEIIESVEDIVENPNAEVELPVEEIIEPVEEIIEPVEEIVEENPLEQIVAEKLADTAPVEENTFRNRKFKHRRNRNIKRNFYRED